ncbi:hypothetical protein AB0J83_32650 [Actinoplanes sp. NPDC049596]|uniref:hypothetical protein n=1 Tax=unclassified Actinoplanes TaxID=2626549 RepID=UPI00342E1C65
MKLASLLSLTLAAGLVGVATPAFAAGAAPTGTYTLDSTGIWPGQTVTLTQTDLADDDVEPGLITRTIKWGDGATTVAAAGETTWKHSYTRLGESTVEVLLSDGEASGPGTFSAGATVAVTEEFGTYRWSKSTVWTYGSYQNLATWNASNIPARSTATWTSWGDNTKTLLRQGTSTTAEHWYGPGTWTPQTTLKNAQGKSQPVASPPLSVLTDGTAPTVALTYPGSPNKAASWATIRGTAHDSQSGADLAAVWLWKYNTAGVEYYYNFGAKTWVRYTGQSLDNVPESVWGMSAVSAAGTWSVPVKGLTKGWIIEPQYQAADKVGNWSDLTWRQITLNS